jgi:LPS sulfotransferase NodH
MRAGNFVMDSYMICATPRTGSTLLCDLLASTNAAGNPNSYFMSEMDPAWAEALGYPVRARLSDADYAAAMLKAAIKAGKGQTEIFGLRLMRKDLDALSALIGKVFPGLPSDKGRLQAAFGRILFIHLAREDKLAQAVSLVKAEQTGLWHVAPDGSELERLAPPREPLYDFDRVAARLAQLEQYEAAWATWFELQGIEPLRLGYERLSINPGEAVSRICEALGLRQPAPEGLKPGVAKLADAVSLEWMRNYQRDLRALSD